MMCTDKTLNDEPFIINCLGLKCPLPVLRLEKHVQAGQKYVRIISDDPVSVIDIPLATQNLGGTILSQSRQENANTFDIRFDKA